jgi:2-aminoadipate transaminase
VNSLFSFSKTLAPGLRQGWIVAAPEIITKLDLAKQPVDLCTGGLSQLVAREFLEAGLLPAQIARLCGIYTERREAMLAALERHVDPSWGVRWTRPEGGLFLWLTLPEWMDAGELFELALRENVAFVIGSAFHCDGSGRNTLRLNFTYPGPEQLDVAVARLARCIGTMLEQPSGASACRPGV